MLVVSDSSPLNFLVRVECVDVLARLFESVLIPPAVLDELTRDATPDLVREYFYSPPTWIRIQAPSTIEPIAKLGPGEEAAISLAREVGADLILLDDREARRAAAMRGLSVVGLLGILDRADQHRLLSLANVAAKLPAEYRIDRALLLAAIRGSQQRRSSPGEERPS